MCYSAKVRAEYRAYVKEFGAHLTLDEYVKEYWEQFGDEWVPKLPQAIRAWFDDPTVPGQAELHEVVAAWKARTIAKTETDLFAQVKRKADAERALQAKITKKAQEDLRISTNKIGHFKTKLDDLKRSELKPRDSRIYPGTLVPVIVWEDGRRVIRFMRYQCRLPGWNEKTERQYPGTYNARRDKLESSWSQLFGRRHGIILADAFYEHVPRHKLEQRELGAGEAEEDVVLEFKPRGIGTMAVACLWNASPVDGRPDLLSFAAITDEPPPEVAEAGHDRCIIPIKRENIDAWLQPDPKNVAASYAILDDRERPYYEHEIAAAA
ncbi:hypothetical protein A7A76_07890 [Lysobacter enzymogenes]|uniref:SOS response-associated peptidase family protein n=1 Tax=Lysobacter enzymogenes TaxID=69 RepID=UPI0019D120B2|nr:SOS response-associated peptidase family protein [Lysobacter enzymogenes]MBN7139015.1 hypothetical protein [Lysobacter enzymogenes]